MKGSGILLFIFILSGFCASRCGATVYHSDGSAADVQQIHDTQAVDGDTITLPVGTFSWTTHVRITKGITISGNTTVNSDTGVCNDLTKLVDNLDPNFQGGEGYFHCTANTGQNLRITGITFTSTGGNTETKFNGAIRVSGDSTTIRFDHLHATNLFHSNFIAVYDNTRGVADHIVIDNIPGQNCQNRAFNGVGAGGFGDEVFSRSAGYGTSDFFFFEDFYVDNSNQPFSAGGGWDANSGGKYVVRHSQLWDVEILCHGTESGRDRGGRAYELYNNEYHWDYFTGLDGVRSGTMIAHDNTFDGIKPDGYALQTYRMIFDFDGTWRGSTGANPWDLNVTEPDGTHVDGHPPYLFESGTVTGVVGGFNGSISDNTKNWNLNQWATYNLRNTSNGDTWLIDGNSATTLNIHTWEDGSNHQAWTIGDGYEIHKVIQTLDQPGGGQCDAISGPNPTPHWLHQVREGCYSWNNVFTPNGQHINWNPGSPNLQEGRDYFSDTPMPGYTPYTYPHPLVTGTGTPTPTPTGTPAPTPSATPTPIPSPTSTATVTPTATPAPSATISPTPGPTTTPTPSPTATPVPGGNPPTDFNHDGHPDYLLYNAGTGQTAVWYLNNNAYIGGAYAPTLPVGWRVIDVADFNRDSHSDYALFAPNTNQTALWYLSGPTFIGSTYGPTLPDEWEFVGTADFNGDNKPDYVLYNAGTRQTAVWYMDNNVHIGGGYGPTLPPGWTLVGVADFNGDGHPDYAVVYTSTGQTAIGYLSGLTLIGAALGPTIPGGWALVATADFNGDGSPDYTLYQASTRRTAIWYLNNNVFVGSAYGPTLPAGWILAAP
jgi:hypothetical protein